MLLDGKVALITGAGSGIGAATARLMAGAGAAVVVVDRDEDASVRVAEAISDAGGRSSAFVADVGDEAAISAMVDHAVQRFGGLHILHNNAAMVGAALHADRGVETMDAAVWDEMIAVNVRSAALGCKHAIPVLRRSGSSSIINTASAAAGLGDYERTAYGASKAAMLNLTRYVATQHGKEGIRCNAIVPGLVMTPSADVYLSAPEKALLLDAMLVPSFGVPEDVAELAMFLASDKSRYITGQSIWIDGGASARSQNALAAVLAG